MLQIPDFVCLGVLDRDLSPRLLYLMICEFYGELLSAFLDVNLLALTVVGFLKRLREM